MITGVSFILLPFYDLKISQAIYNPNSGLAIFIQDYGEIPGWLTILFASILFAWNSKSIWEKIIAFFVASISLAAISSGIGYWTILVFTIILIFAFRIIANEANLVQVMSFARVTLKMAFFGPLIITQIVKSSWGRIRFRDLDNIADYTQWFEINGFTGNRSFPSGHVAMGVMVLPLLILVNWYSINKSIKLLLNSMIIVWTFLVGLGRMINGAHFATDVIFSIWLGITLFIYFKNRQNNSDLIFNLSTT